MKRKDKNKNKLLKYIPVFISTIIIVFALYLRNRIYNIDFEQSIYSLMKTSGTSVNALYAGAIYITIGTLILFPILVIPIAFIDRKLMLNIKIKDKIKKIKIFPIEKIKTYNICLFVFSALFICYVVGIFDYIYYEVQETAIFDNYYVKAEDVKITFPEEKQNLIYIFLESTEITNISKDNGGAFTVSIMPNLEQMALDNLNFSNSDLLGGANDSYGTDWTASAMIAQTSGLPTKVLLKDFKEDSTAFENVNTLGDILYENGYNNYLLIGSIAEFGGRAPYFESHHYEIDDYYTAVDDGRIDEDYFEWWGYEDAKLFTYAKDKLTKLSKKEEPFNLTLLTADTHFTDGYIDKSCEEKFDNHYANSFYCEDRLIKDFMDWLKEQDFYENTTIILQGDHLTMQQDFYKKHEYIDKDYVRTTYNVIINAKSDYVNNKNRVFTTLDMFPTTLASIGADIEGNRLGLGTNLFSSEKTIPEEMGIDNFNKELRKHSTMYSKKIRG